MHNTAVAGYIADHGAVMTRGCIEEAGADRSILEHLHSAYTRTLNAAVPRIEAQTAH